MPISLENQKRRVLEGVLQLHKVGFEGESASNVSVDRLQDQIDTVHREYNKARLAWGRMVELQGAVAARESIADGLSGVPEDVAAQFSSIRSAVLSLLTAYENNFGSGLPTKSFAYTESGLTGELEGGFSDLLVSAPIVASLNTLCANLRSACLPLIVTE
jgi:hypothetical protein